MTSAAFIKGLFAFLCSVGLGLAGLVMMFLAEQKTATDYTYYFHWAFGGGLVFLGVAFGLMFYDQDDRVSTSFDEQQ